VNALAIKSEASTNTTVRLARAISHVKPGVTQAMLGLEKQVRQAGFDHKLLHLVRMRASQINACAYCLDMHSKDARAIGETEQRL
jgi:AhpD family alkylhydroperoxidase